MVTLGLVALLALSCGQGPCYKTKSVYLPSTATPFPDGESVFAHCQGCPVMPQIPGVDDGGPVTTCAISFGYLQPAAYVLCGYGPGGRTTWSGANGAVSNLPNLFAFCAEHCQDMEALGNCMITANAQGVQSFACGGGRSCD